jgi:CubicO group peptidase (beta-lactamase class C family)
MLRHKERPGRIFGVAFSSLLAAAMMSGTATAGQAGNAGPPPGVQQSLDTIVAAGIPGVVAYTDDPRVTAPYAVQHDWDFTWAPRQLVAIAVSHPPLFAPGSRYSYSNTNYILAGLIIQAVTHESPIAEVYQRILRPLGLSDTSFPYRGPSVRGPHLDGYYANYLDVTYLSPSWAYTAGAIISPSRIWPASTGLCSPAACCRRPSNASWKPPFPPGHQE